MTSRRKHDSLASLVCQVVEVVEVVEVVLTLMLEPVVDIVGQEGPCR